jgi:hypothetical protein
MLLEEPGLLSSVHADLVCGHITKWVQNSHSQAVTREEQVVLQLLSFLRIVHVEL